MNNIDKIDEIYFKMVTDFNFEKRVDQYRMSRKIMENLEQQNCCLIEAPTGIGKTLAYLIPTFLYAIENDKKIVISTNTINLQQQLIEKDIPLLEKILGEKLEYAIVKGRSNYLCTTRLKQNCTNPDFLNWAKTTKIGDRAEINFKYEINEWNSICCDKDYCRVAGCSQKNDCFYYKAKRIIFKKQILIINHSVLFSDHIYDNILPEYDTLVIDEAHNIENIARTYFELNFDFSEILSFLGITHNYKTNAGVFNNFVDKLDFDIKKYSDKFIEYINNLYTELSNLSDRLELFVYNKKSKNIKLDIIKSEFLNFDNIINSILNNFYELDKIERVINEKTELIENEEKNIFYFIYNKIYEKLSILQKLKEQNSNEVLWLSQKNNESICINITPIDISKQLNELLQNKIVIMTSATLKVNDKFDFIKSRIGLESFANYSFNSPFDYDSNMKIYLNDNDVDPNNNDFMDFVVEYINEFLSEDKLGTFILCTSYSQVEYIQNRIDAKSFDIFVQGQMSRNKLIENFVKSDKAILIGTDSFWEGVDVKGEKLSNVIILKLPFQVPDNPVMEAIIESVKNNGQNAFMDYQLPNMIIKLRQGVGRLIRSIDDKGEIHILDNRIEKKDMVVLLKTLYQQKE